MVTRRQKQLLDYIAGRLADGVCPSYQEMAEAVGLRSKSGIHRLVQGLEERGFIRRLPERARSIEIVRQAPGDAPDAELVRWVAQIAATGFSDPAAYVNAYRALDALARRHGVVPPGATAGH